MADAPLAYSVDISGVTAGIEKLLDTVENGKTISALALGFEIIRLSAFEVPHDKGSLQNSATVQEIDGDVVLGYHEPYAARLHEHPEYRFQKGRKGKYLVDPVIRNAAALGVTFGQSLDKEVNG